MSEAKFRESIAWNKAMELTKAVYEATSNFPKQEMFGLTNQLRRASVSIASNLAEGQGRLTLREFLHFLGVARGEWGMWRSYSQRRRLQKRYAASSVLRLRRRVRG